jgi:hypothetical protein
MAKLHPFALQVSDIAGARRWYCSEFDVEICYQDGARRMRRFDEIGMALAAPRSNPPQRWPISPRLNQRPLPPRGMLRRMAAFQKLDRQNWVQRVSRTFGQAAVRIALPGLFRRTWSNGSNMAYS